MNLITVVAALVLTVGCFSNEQVLAAKSKHNNFKVTNKSNGKICVEIWSKKLEINPNTKHQKKEIAVGETINMPILKTHDIAKIKITYSDGSVRQKSNFKVMHDGYDEHSRRNSRVYRGTMTVYEDRAEITTQKAGVLLKIK